jgi:RNA polymerase sigma-70 factor (ECF subfamily)
MQINVEQVIANPRALLFRVAANLAVDYLRRDKHQAAHRSAEAIAAAIPDTHPSVETVVFSKQQVVLLKQAIAELSPKCREVFILHKFKHLSYSEIAARLGIARSTVVKHMIKALEHCKRRVDAGSL